MRIEVNVQTGEVKYIEEDIQPTEVPAEVPAEVPPTQDEGAAQ